MNLDDFIITCFCLVDEMLPSVTAGQRLRARGPMPKLSDSEVMTMEIVGMYLGKSQDKELFEYFCQHWSHFFPKNLHIGLVRALKSILCIIFKKVCTIIARYVN